MNQVVQSYRGWKQVKLFPLLFCLLVVSALAKPDSPPVREELIVCGDKEVFILDLAVDASKKIWSWKAADHPEIPEDVRKKFGSTDDCKPVDGGTNILISSSGGAVALVERATGKTLFWAVVANAHSAEVLPGGRILAAGSTAKDGNRIVLFDRARSGVELASYPLQGAHGVVWDQDANCVWALGEMELHTYLLNEWETAKPSLTLKQKLDLPDAGGHDLRPVPGTRKLIVTTRKNVWTFDREKNSFVEDNQIGSLVGVKSMDIHPSTGRVAYIKAETSWWAARIILLKPGGEINLPGERLYKARWNP